MLTPTEIRYNKEARRLTVSYDDGTTYELPAEFLRVHSPSAEVRGHGGPMVLVTGKESVGISSIEPVGNYAVRLVFDDGHDTGLYSWSVLQELGEQQDALWQEYLARLEAAGHARDESR